MHDGLAEGANKHQLSGGEIRMAADPFIKCLRDQFLAGGKCSDIEDMAEKVGKPGRGLLVGFAQPFLGNKEIRSVERCGKGLQDTRIQSLTLLESLQGKIVAGEIPNQHLHSSAVGLGKGPLTR